MARHRTQIPIGWRREGPRIALERPGGSPLSAARVEVYRGYEGGVVVGYLAVLYSGGRNGWTVDTWWNKRFSGRRLTLLDKMVAEVKAEGYQEVAPS